MTRYGHTLRGQEAEAISRLPDLSMPDRQAQKATGTDGKGIDCGVRLGVFLRTEVWRSADNYREQPRWR